MIKSLVLTRKVNIEVSKSGKFCVGDVKLEVKNTPFVRYRFPITSEEDIKYIQGMQEKFPKSVHLVEITVGDGCTSILELLKEHTDIAKFLYVNVTDAVVNEGIPLHEQESLAESTQYCVDRYMIKDNTSMMYPLLADKLKAEIVEYLNGAVKASDIGVCGSPLSFRHSDAEGQACLTALWARKIMANYLKDDDIAIPTASHEKMDCCGCIHYSMIDSDCRLKEKEKSKKSLSGGPEKGESKVSGGKKKPKVSGVISWIDEL